MQLDIYQYKNTLKITIASIAVCISLVSLYYTNLLVQKLAERETKLIDLYAKGLQNIVSDDATEGFTFMFQDIVEANNSIPVILTDCDLKPISYRNINIDQRLSQEKKNQILESEIKVMMQVYQPIEVKFAENQKNFIFYKNSDLILYLKYYPILQILVLLGLMAVAYILFSISRKSEQNHVWVGMAKETAHQLATPISSLIAWVEIIKSDDRMNISNDITDELTKDINRLEIITNRFSQIGSKATLKSENLTELIVNLVNYLRVRLSDQVEFDISQFENQSFTCKLNKPLFEWVIENICKNAVDAMEGKGSIYIKILSNDNKYITIDIRDTGKGIAKKNLKSVFKPGFTTKSRGWGLGLSLCKRIVEEYHHGLIFVKEPEKNEGATFRIKLLK